MALDVSPGQRLATSTHNAAFSKLSRYLVCNVYLAGVKVSFSLALDDFIGTVAGLAVCMASGLGMGELQISWVCALSPRNLNAF